MELDNHGNIIKETIIDIRNAAGILDSIACGVGVISVGDEGIKPLFMNKGYKGILSDYDERDNEKFEKDVFWSVYNEDLPVLKEKLQASIQTGEKTNDVYRIRRKGGGFRYIRIETAIAVREENGDTAFLVTVTDVTELKETEAERENHQKFMYNLLQISPCAIVFFTATEPHRLTSANDEAVRLYGCSSEEELIGNIAFSKVHPDERPSTYAVMEQAFRTGEKVRYLHRIIKKDGTYFWANGSLMLTMNSKGEEVVMAAFIDVSDEKNAELALEEERERYKLAVEISNDVLFEYDKRTKVFRSYENVVRDEHAYDVLKVEIEDYEKSVRDNGYIHPDDVEDMLYTVTEGGRKSAEYRIHHMSDEEGIFRWYSVQSTLVYENGEPVKVIGTIRSIDEFKRMQFENASLNKKFLMSLMNIYDVMIELNVSSNEILRYSREEGGMASIDSFSCSDLEYDFGRYIYSEDIPVVLNAFSRESIDRVYRGEQSEIYTEFRRMRKDRTHYWCAALMQHATWDDDILMVFARDIDQTKKREMADRRRLAEALAEAEQANIDKNEFLSRISHDVRTPLNAILGMVSIARITTEDRAKTMDCLTKVNTAASYLLAIMNDILDMAKAENAELRLSVTSFRIEEVIRDVSAIITPQANERGISFEICLNRSMNDGYLGDRIRMNRVIMNLLTNALRYTNKGGKVLLAISEKSREDDKAVLEFRIQDNGIGISEKFLKVMFKPFEQEHADSSRAGIGSGLGLAIVERFVKLMEGEIRVESQLGVGTVFTVSVPVGIQKKTVQDIQERHGEITQGYGAAGCVLLAEDNEINQEIARMLLEMESFEVDSVSNGQEAVARFQSDGDRYSAILMDIRMPVMDGIEATRLIRALGSEHARKIPIIAMTANAFQADIEAAIACGMNDYLTKPIDTEQMYITVSKYV